MSKPEEDEDGHDSKPTPFSLIVCAEGVNHTFQYKQRSTAFQQYTKVKNAAPADELEIEDDFGVLTGIRRDGIRSFRLEDISRGHRANFGLKLAELYAAKDFQYLIDNKHAALKMITARAPGGILRPGN